VRAFPPMLHDVAASPALRSKEGVGQCATDEAKAEVAALALHLEALMLTNKTLLCQLEEAKQRASSVGAQLQEASAQECARRGRGRDEIYHADDDSDDDSPPKYRGTANEPLPRISILSSSGPQDEFEDFPVEDELDPGSVTFRCTREEHTGEWSRAEIRLGSGDQLRLSALRRAVRALGTLVARGGADDALVLEQLNQLKACGL